MTQLSWWFVCDWPRYLRYYRDFVVGCPLHGIRWRELNTFGRNYCRACGRFLS